MLKSPIIFVLVSLLFSCSSRENDVRVYRVAKAIAPQTSVAATESPAQSSSGFRWISPKGWKEMPGTEFRLASFDIESKQGKADASIVVLGGDAGGMEANVNRWREQAGLPAESAEQIEKSAKKGKSQAGEFRVIEIPGAAGKASILAAIFSLPGKTLFVKLSASQDVLKSQKAAFMALCQSMRN